MAANGHDLWCSTRKLSASPKSTTTEAALGRQLQECPFRETKQPSRGTASRGNIQYSQFCPQKYSTAALATRIDARSRDSWPAAHGSFLCGLPRRSGKGDLLNFLRGLAAKNSQDDELGLLRLQHIGTRTSGRSMLGVRKIIILPCYLLE